MNQKMTTAGEPSCRKPVVAAVRARTPVVMGTKCLRLLGKCDWSTSVDVLMYLPWRRMTSTGGHVTRPQGYTQAAEEQLSWLLVLCLPYCQALLFAGISGAASFLLLTFLLLFVVARSQAIHRTLSACLTDALAIWIAPILDRRARWVSEHLQVVRCGPSLTASFQRPPPLFS